MEPFKLPDSARSVNARRAPCSSAASWAMRSAAESKRFVSRRRATKPTCTGFTIEIAARVEQVRLDGAPLVAEGGTTAEIHHPAEGSTRRIDMDSVYTVGRKKLPRRFRQHVDGGKAEPATARLAGDDPA